MCVCVGGGGGGVFIGVTVFFFLILILYLVYYQYTNSFFFLITYQSLITYNLVTLYNVWSVHWGCLEHQENIMSTSGGNIEYIRGCSIHLRDIMIHEHTGDVRYIVIFNINQSFLSISSPTLIMISILIYS